MNGLKKKTSWFNNCNILDCFVASLLAMTSLPYGAINTVRAKRSNPAGSINIHLTPTRLFSALNVLKPYKLLCALALLLLCACKQIPEHCGNYVLVDPNTGKCEAENDITTTPPSDHVHVWGAWEVTTPATCAAAGVETRTCTLDPSHKETRALAQLTGAACNSGGGGGDNVSQTVGGYTFEMVAVAGGTFTMGCTAEQGSDCYSDESPAHSVTLSSYYIGKYEVTQGLWKAVMGSLPSSLTSSSSYGYGDEYPVYNVSWNQVKVFIDSLNRKTGKTYRLPTEAEWEYAARGGNKSGGYKYSGSNTLGNVAWYGDNSGSKTHEVGTKSPNELGIYDMSGNVWEWVSDWYGAYSSSAQTNPTGPATGSFRVTRGGGWNGDGRNCRVSFRSYSGPGGSGNNIGFRLVLSPP